MHADAFVDALGSGVPIVLDGGLATQREAMLADGSEYRGRYGRSEAWLRDFHRERLAVLAATNADVLALETIPEVEEGAALVALLDDLPGAAAWVSFTCADAARLRSGAAI